MLKDRLHIVAFFLQLLFFGAAFVVSFAFQFDFVVWADQTVTLSHIPGERIDFVFRDFDVVYLANCDLSELRLYFPNFYLLIFACFWFVRLLVLGLILLFIQRSFKFGNLKTIHEWFREFNPLLHLWLSMTLAIVFYTGFRDLAFDSQYFQLALARVFLGLNVLVLGLFLLANLERLRLMVRGFLFEPILPYSLAITRILFFGYLVLVYKAMVFQYGADIGKLPTQPLPGIGWLIEILPLSSSIYTVLCYCGIAFSLLAALGYRTRLFMVLNGVTIFYIMAAPNFYGKLWHQQLPIWISWILAASPCADVLSFDSRLKNTDPVNVNYAFHLRIIWLQFGLIYFWAGFYKLWDSGFDWALNDTVVNLITIEWFEHYDKVPSLRIDRYPLLIKMGALITILFELFYPFLLLNNRTRFIPVVGGLLMHNLLGKFMYIGFFFFLQVFYIVFIPWNWMLQRVWPKLKAQTPIAQGKVRYWTPSILIPILIVSANAFCGIFKINSYPFSIYPVYTDVVADSVAYFEYRILDRGLESLDHRDEARNTRFRWEDYSRMEYEMIRQYVATDSIDTNGVSTMWERWQIGVPALAEIDSVEVYVSWRYLNPDSAKHPFRSDYVMTILD